MIIRLKKLEDFDKHYDDFKEEVAKKRLERDANYKKTSSSSGGSTEVEKPAKDAVSISDIEAASTDQQQ